MKTEFVYPQETAVLMGTNARPVATGGLTLRDWFAGQALVGLLDRDSPETDAAWAYKMADAMLAARSPPCPAPS